MQGAGCRIQGSGFRVQGSGFRVGVQDSRFRVQGSGLRVQGAGCRGAPVGGSKVREAAGRVVFAVVTRLEKTPHLVTSDGAS